MGNDATITLDGPRCLVCLGLRFAAAARERFGAIEIDRGTVTDVADHICHVAAVGGVASVGIGSDFDGMEATPVGLEDTSCYPAITGELLERGWSEEDVRSVLGGNAMRALRVAEDAALTAA